MRRRSFAIVVAVAAIAGCNGGNSDLSPDADAKLRANMARELTPEEIAKMGGGDKGVPPPVRRN